MTREEIVETLEEIALLLELRGDNAFRVRAYANGARALETLEGDLEEMIESGELAAVKGIGEALADKIATLCRDEPLEFYDALKASVAPGLLDIVQIPGLGGKKAKYLHDQLGVASVEALKRACENGAVAGLKGFGKKTEANILNGIQNMEAYARRHLWWDAAERARGIVEGLRGLPQVERAEAAGSLRRGRETVGDLDFIAASEAPGPVMDWFVGRDDVAEVQSRGETKSSVRFDTGLQADLRVVPRARFPFALHHFTGSKEHNVAMRQRAQARGYSLSEWGLAPAGAGDDVSSGALGIGSEAELFAFVGLAEIPPELREDWGEFEAAEAGALPRLLESGALRGALHNHTTASDGRASLEAMADAADARGWSYIGLADHSKSSVQANGLDEDRVREQLERVREANASGRFSARLFAGIECDILPDGRLDLADDLLAELDYVVVSVHSAFGQSEDAMTRRVLRALEHPSASILGHPTGRLLLRREPYAVDMRRVIDAAAANRVAIEINANPRRLDMDWRLWRNAAEKGVMCAINPDAHSTEGLDYVDAGVNVARKGWLGPDNVLNARDAEGVARWFAERR